VSASPLIDHLTGRDAEKIGKNLLEESEVEAALRRLDRLTQNEARTATAQTLEVVYHLLQNMSLLMEGEQISLASSLIP
jgi:hypothetical protein